MCHGFNNIAVLLYTHIATSYNISVVVLALITRAVLRLECSLDCISGSPTKYFHFLTVSVSFEIKKM